MSEGNGHILVTNTESFEEDVLGNPLPVLLDFWGPKCSHCLSLMPHVEKLAEKYSGQLAVCKILSRENWRVAVGLKVTSLPTMILFERGEEKVRLLGEIAPAEIESAIRQVLGK